MGDLTKKFFQCISLLILGSLISPITLSAQEAKSVGNFRFSWYTELGAGVFSVSEDVKLLDQDQGDIGFYLGFLGEFQPYGGRIALRSGLKYQEGGSIKKFVINKTNEYRFKGLVIPLELKFNIAEKKADRTYLIGGASFNLNLSNRKELEMFSDVFFTENFTLRIGIGTFITPLRNFILGMESRFFISNIVKTRLLSSATFNSRLSGLELGLWLKFK